MAHELNSADWNPAHFSTIGGESLFTIIQRRFLILAPPSLETYDQALPHQIPYAHDITNGGAFKDHPVLFLILDNCLAIDREPFMPLVRSVFIYFITFWNMDEVASKPSALYFATQLEETLHLLRWMEWVNGQRKPEHQYLHDFPFF